MLFAITFVILTCCVVPIFVFLLVKQQTKLYEQSLIIKKFEKAAKEKSLEEKKIVLPFPFDMVDRMIGEAKKILRKEMEKEYQERLKKMDERYQDAKAKINKLGDENDGLYASEHCLQKQVADLTNKIKSFKLQLQDSERRLLKFYNDSK